MEYHCNQSMGYERVYGVSLSGQLVAEPPAAADMHALMGMLKAMIPCCAMCGKYQVVLQYTRPLNCCQVLQHYQSAGRQSTHALHFCIRLWKDGVTTL
jgi:hypothetical protein